MRLHQAAARRRGADDEGSAMIITLMVMALVTALATTVATLTIDNLQSSWRAQQAGAALNAADAGVSQAMSYLRNPTDGGVSDLNTCSPTCASNPWGNKNSPTTVTIGGTAQEKYKAWIEPVVKFTGSDPGHYRIHSTGFAADTASRSVIVDVSVTTIEFPKAVFAKSITGGGSASMTRESIFSTGCVYRRDNIAMVPGQLDAAYGIPIAVHTSRYITGSNGTTPDCPSSDNKLIHKDGACNSAYPYDQDRLGGDLTSTACATGQTTYPDYYGPQNLDGVAGDDVVGSYIKDDAALLKLFDLGSAGLAQNEIDRLRAVAQAQGNYWTEPTGWIDPDEPNAVMFFDLTKGANVGGTIDLNDVDGFGRDGDLDDGDAGCQSKSLVIVIDGGNARLNSNQQLFANLVLTSAAPNGQVFKANGTSNFIGTILADTVNLVGNVDISLDDCFLANTNPALLEFKVDSYQEEDRGLS